MAKYRAIQVDFWEDGFVLDLTPEEKYFYLYLLSNSRTTQCGCYELPYKVVEMQTGYNRETVQKLLKRFEDYGKTSYNEETKEILIKNWHKHNFSKSPKVKNCILKEIEKIKSKDYKDYLYRVCIEYGYPIDTVSIDYKNSNNSLDKDLDSLFIDSGEKEKEKEKKRKRKEKEKQRTDWQTNLSNFSKLYESNIEVINQLAGEWLIEMTTTIDYPLFKRAIEICTERGNLNLGYLKGVIKRWLDNNITTYDQLKAYELQTKAKDKPRQQESAEKQNMDFLDRLEEKFKVSNGNDAIDPNSERYKRMLELERELEGDD
ncbi:MAG: DnaD domain protein [Intestinibacter bartlettii]|uniref:DnaD domain protein n=1 Tax=Intestinibacter bartlettii TaxID=261299 RepID=UPI0039A26EA2